MSKNNIARQTRKIKMKGLRVPLCFISFLGWIHVRQGKVEKKETLISSNWINRMQKDFNAYCAAILKIMGSILLPLRMELAKLDNTQRDNIRELSLLEKRLSDWQPETVEEKRKYKKLEKRMAEVRARCSANMKEIIDLKLKIYETRHQGRQMIQEIKRKTETVILTYLQGAKLIVEDNELSDAVREGELYTQYCKYENECLEREGELYV